MALKIINSGDLKDPIVAFGDDLQRAEDVMEQTADAYSRRAYVRALFAMIEGTVYILKQTTLSAAMGSHAPISLAEYAILAEEAFDLDSSGSPRTQTKYLKLPDNLRFAVSAVNKVFSGQVILDVGSNEWAEFRRAIRIRNRITHPRSLNDFDVSIAESELCRRVRGWFLDVAWACISQVIDRVKRVQEGTSNQA